MSVYDSKWANLPESEADLVPVTTHKKGWSRKRKMVVAGAAIGAILLPGAAWAAVSLFGFGTFSAAAATPTNLSINGTPTLDGTLVPGQTRGVVGSVHNPNDFPVKITRVILKTSSLHAVPPVTSPVTPESDCKISLVGGTPGATSFPAHSPNPAAPGVVFTLAAPVTIGAGNDGDVTVPGIIKQDPTASVLCGVLGDYAVEGIAGS